MFFDTQLHCDETSVSPLPSRLLGAILYGPRAPLLAESLASPAHSVHHAAPLNFIVGDSDARYPHSSPKVIELSIPEADLISKLRQPHAAWYPLAEAIRTRSQCLRLTLPFGPNIAVGVRRLADGFRGTRFLIDPFRHGPESGWQAQVRLAECDNVWLTSLGLRKWPRREDQEDALFFTMGEVGASKLLYASGGSLSQLQFDAEKWLSDFSCVDADQRSLILTLNAGELFC